MQEDDGTGHKRPHEDDGLLSAEDPQQKARIERIRRASRFRGDDKIMIFLYLVVAIAVIVAFLKFDSKFPNISLNFKSTLPSLQQSILKSYGDCPAICGRGFRHSRSLTGRKVLADCSADITCTRIEMDVAPDRSDWRMNEKPAREHRTIHVMFAMKQENLNELEQRLFEISDPLHPDYGKWMSQDEIDRMTAPLPHRVSAVKSWIKSFGFDEHEIKHVSANADFIGVHATVKQANAMFNGKFHEFIHLPTGNKVLRLRGDSYSLPDFIADHVDFVTPNVRFHVAHPVRQDGLDGYHNFNQFAPTTTQDFQPIPSEKTPEVLNLIYSLPNGKEYPGAQRGQKQAFLELIGGRYSKKSVRQMFRRYKVRSAKLSRYPATQSAGDTDESILDGTCMTISGSGVETVGFEPGKEHFFLHFALELRAMHPKVRPQVASISYSSDEQADGKLYVNRADHEFMKLTAQGITFLASSGDYGVKGITGKCYKGNQYVPSYPASSPFVTGVGGTAGGVMNPLKTLEEAWSGSGGGFSVIAKRRKYQDAALSRYFERQKKVLEETAHLNPLGSGYPDISASAGTYPIFMDGMESAGGGTSASGPFIGGVFSLLNAYRISKNKPVVGFANPLLYHLHELDQKKVEGDTTFFHDVEKGRTAGCFDEGDGFKAVTGWDPTTGVGTPNVRAILDYLEKQT